MVLNQQNFEKNQWAQFEKNEWDNLLFLEGKFSNLSKDNSKIKKKVTNNFEAVKTDVNHVKSEVPPLKDHVKRLESDIQDLSKNVDEILRILSGQEVLPGYPTDSETDVPDSRFRNTLLLRDSDRNPPDPDECTHCKVRHPYCRKACFV